MPHELAPWRVTVHFRVYYFEPERGPIEYEYVTVGHELTVPISIASAEADAETIRQEYARIKTKFARQLGIYEQHAELLLRHKRGDLTEMRRAMIGGKAHAFHPLLVADYRARSGSPTRTKTWRRRSTFTGRRSGESSKRHVQRA
jgi:hypothetical protein